MIGNSLGKVYDPAITEAHWHDTWRENDLFKAENGSNKPSFSILLPLPPPPPQATGNLHLGHALALTIPDIIARRKKMQGFNILYLPGPDQAGNVARLAGPLGLAIDWSRMRFPPGEVLQKVTDRVFVQLYREGEIYRGDSLRRAGPNASKQWFLKTAGIAEPAIEAVEKEKIIFFPGNWEKEYFRWMHHIRDWCISRQLQEGYKIPAYYCDDCGRLMVEEEKPGKCDQCHSTHITRDPDALDTWFSFALWPFAALGWLDKSQDFKDFFPTSLTPTNPDMIFSGAARAIMLGIHLGKDIPFREVFINGMIRDEKGREKSNAGNIPGDRDIPDIIAGCGADALRFTLAAQAVPGKNISFSSDRLNGFKLFANKIWNASRIVLMRLRGDEDFAVDFAKITDADRWILNGLNNTTMKVNDLADSYQIHKAADLLYRFFRREFCNWYLELAKNDLDNPDTRKTLKLTLFRLLQLLHPFMPFITEEIFHQLNPGHDRFLIQSEFPTFSSELAFPVEFADVETLKKVIKATRKTRTENRIAPKSRIAIFLKSESGKEKKALEKNMRYFDALAGSAGTQIVTDFSTLTFPRGFKGACANWEILLPMDSEEHRLHALAQLEKEAENLENRVAGFEKRLSDDTFIHKTAEAELSGLKKSLRESLNRSDKIRKAINDLL